MLYNLVINICIMFSSLFLITQIFPIHPLQNNSLIAKIVHGTVYGLIGAICMHFSVGLPSSITMDLRYAAVVLPAISGNWLSAFTASIIIVLYSMVFFTFSEASVILGLSVGIGCALLSRLSIPPLKKSIAIMSCIFLLYFIVGYFKRATAPYFSIKEHLLFDSTSFIITFAITVFLGHFYLEYHSQKIKLEQEHQRLIRFDPLTGLLNFQQFHKELNRLLIPDSNICLIIVDCQDLKSMNIELGFHGVNAELQKISAVISRAFDNALIISRYGGDEFAIVIRYDTRELLEPRLKKILEQDIPRESRVALSYGYSFYPEEANTKNELILAAEHMLFSMKRTLWMQREEHLFRAEKLKAVGELAAGMAHEIRNPLTSVKGFLQIAKEKNNYNISSYYEIIMDEISRMSELTAEFLQFSRAGTSQFQLHSIQDCVQHAIQLTESEGLRLGHQIHYLDDLMAPTYLNLDKDKIVQVLLNLIKNAFEAMDQYGVVILKLYRKHQTIYLEVVDKGQGISQEHLDQLFLPFFTTKENGTGLGLSICHKVIQDHGGNITVHSELGSGTTFTVSLPLPDEAGRE